MRIRIELKSSLCAADGDGFGGVIDTDICIDNHGIPYIPARRLKGCLRECAEYIGSEFAEKIFGATGKSDCGSLKLSNAIIENYDELAEECRKNNFNAEKVTQLFTRIIASTAIEDSGKAKDNSLRFMRTVDKSMPWETEKNLVFYAKADIDEQYAAEMEDICKALRHIGYKRNRGFGAVKCTFEKDAENKQIFEYQECENGKKYVIDFALKNNSDLMLGGKKTGETLDYISGTAIKGFLGSEYLKKNPLDEKFENFFMNEDVKFSNMYLTNQKLDEYLPVTGNFGKDKTDSEGIIYNLVCDDCKDKIVKPLKEGYINKEKEIRKANTKIVYHNSIKSEKGGLYTQTCLDSGQYFRGSITADGECINEFAKLLTTVPIRLGRSKTAQYSECSLVGFEVRECQNEKVRIKGEWTMFVLESDVILSNSEVNTLAETLGTGKISEERVECGEIHPASSIKYRNIAGFNTAMRLQRPHKRAFGAGSVIICKTDNKEFESVVYIGERQSEGFGKIRIFDADEFMKNSKPLKNIEKISNNSIEKIKNKISFMNDVEKMRSEAIKYAEKNHHNFKDLTAAFTGRVTLMIEEAESYIDLINHVKSIKSQNKQELAETLIGNSNSEQYKTLGWDTQREYLLIIFTLAKYYLKQEAK